MDDVERDAIEFNEIAEDLGVTLLCPERESQESSFIRFCYQLAAPVMISACKNSRPMRLNVGLIDRSDLNAWAISSPTTDYIGLHSGLMHALKSISRALMSHSFILPNVGEPSTVRKVVFPIAATAIPWGPQIAVVAPLEDAKREHLASCLAALCVAFIFYHEFGHIYNGHTDWLSEHRGISLISEFKIPSRERFVGLTRQTLERDADLFAVQAITQFAMQPVIRRYDGIAAWKLPPYNWVGSQGDAMALICVASQIVNMVYANAKELSETTLFQLEHPHPAIRSYLIALGLLQVVPFRTGLPMLEEKFSLDVFEKLSDGFNAWCGVFGSDSASALNDSAAMQTFFNIYGSYENEWARIRPELDKFKRGGILPPANFTENPNFSSGI